MKLRVTTDLSGDELAKALAATAKAHGVDDRLAELLGNHESRLPSWLNWEQRLRELSRDITGEEKWANADIQKTEDRMVKHAMAFAASWLSGILPSIRQLLLSPAPIHFDDFLRETDQSPLQIEIIVQSITNVHDIAQREFNRMQSMPSRGDWVEDIPEPIARRVSDPFLTTISNRQRMLAEWIARQSAASKMREWADGIREDVRWHVVQAIRTGMSARELERRLRNRWDDYGQHFRTIAATELAMAYNDAALMLMAGRHVVIPPIGDKKVCKICRRLLEGKVFYVSPIPIKNPTKRQLEQYLWPGKSNIGRKQSEWVPCLPLHPNCRHVAVLYRGGDPYEYKAK